MDKSPDRLIQKAHDLTMCVLHQCKRFGLIANTKKGKTALVLALRGKGSQKVAAREFANDKRTVKIVIPDGTEYVIHVEANYLHLGGYLNRQADMAHEARRRTAVARTEYDSVRQQVFHNKHIPMPSRLSIFNGLVGSTYHNLALWIPGSKAWSQPPRGYDGLVKKLLSSQLYGEVLHKISREEAYALTGASTLDVKAAHKRLSFLTNMVRHGSEEIWAVMQLEYGWAAQAWTDLQWVRDWYGQPLPVLSRDNWPEWWHVLAKPSGWVRMLAKKAGQCLRLRCLKK